MYKPGFQHRALRRCKGGALLPSCRPSLEPLLNSFQQTSPVFAVGMLACGMGMVNSSYGYPVGQVGTSIVVESHM